MIMKKWKQRPRWIRTTFIVVAAVVALAAVRVIVAVITGPSYPAWCASAEHIQVTPGEPAPIQQQLAALKQAISQQGQVVSITGLPTQEAGLLAAMELKAELHARCGLG
jgi:hypothetical protein